MKERLNEMNEWKNEWIDKLCQLCHFKVEILIFWRDVHKTLTRTTESSPEMGHSSRSMLSVKCTWEYWIQTLLKVKLAKPTELISHRSSSTYIPLNTMFEYWDCNIELLVLSLK